MVTHLVGLFAWRCLSARMGLCLYTDSVRAHPKCVCCWGVVRGLLSWKLHIPADSCLGPLNMWMWLCRVSWLLGCGTATGGVSNGSQKTMRHQCYGEWSLPLRAAQDCSSFSGIEAEPNACTHGRTQRTLHVSPNRQSVVGKEGSLSLGHRRRCSKKVIRLHMPVGVCNQVCSWWPSALIEVVSVLTKCAIMHLQCA